MDRTVKKLSTSDGKKPQFRPFSALEGMPFLVKIFEGKHAIWSIDKETESGKIGRSVQYFPYPSQSPLGKDGGASFEGPQKGAANRHHQRWRELRHTRIGTARQILQALRQVFPYYPEILQSWFADFQTFSYFCPRFYSTTDAYSHSRKYR